jgi:hypothetical protein
MRPATRSVFFLVALTATMLIEVGGVDQLTRVPCPRMRTLLRS